MDESEVRDAVADRLDDSDGSEAATVAVFATVDDAVRGGEIDDLRDQLPESYGAVLTEAGVDDPY